MAGLQAQVEEGPEQGRVHVRVRALKGPRCDGWPAAEARLKARVRVRVRVSVSSEHWPCRYGV